MINRDKEISVEKKKLWLRMAKRMKIVHAIYKFDNLKNCPGYEEDGFIRYMRETPVDIDIVAKRLRDVNRRFIDNSLQESLHIDYWFDNAR